MKIFSSVFKRAPEAIQLSDWLENMMEAFHKLGAETLSQDKSSPDMLVYFTLLNSTSSTRNVLHTAPGIASRIGATYGELRAYFESLWQLVLLHKFTTPQEHDKISKLYADVFMRLERTMDALFSRNPNLKRCLKDAVGEPYVRQPSAAMLDYIQECPRDPKHVTGVKVDDNVQVLALTIQRDGRLSHEERNSIVRILAEDTRKSLRMKFLTQFDFPKCKFLDLPDEFYRRPTDHE